jgi:hypothetical protein
MRVALGVFLYTYKYRGQQCMILFIVFLSSYHTTNHDKCNQKHQIGTNERVFSRIVSYIDTGTATISQHVWNSEFVSEIGNP